MRYGIDSSIIPLRRESEMISKKSVMAAELDLERRLERGGYVGRCLALAGWREQDDEWLLAMLYRLLRGLTVTDLTEAEEVSAGRKLAPRLKDVFARFVANPDKFKKRSHAEVVAMLEGVEVKTTLSVPADGTLRHTHRYVFASNDAVVGLCVAHLSDPTFGRGVIRKCQWEPCGRFFWRQGKRIYCSDECTNSADAKFAVDRQQKYRDRVTNKRTARRPR